MRTWRTIIAGMATMLATQFALAQNFIKTDLALSFDGGKKVVQTFDFNLNRTDAVEEDNAGTFFLYTKNRFYIIPTVDANIGESVSTANNNIVTQVKIGKVFVWTSHKDEASQAVSFFKLAAEVSPTYNSDKSFQEKLYYGQLKVIINPVWNKFGGTATNSFISREISLAFDPVMNIGAHDSKTYLINEGYSAAGFNSSLTLAFYKQDKKNSQVENWVVKAGGDYYHLFSEIKALYSKKYYGQLSASVDKSVTSKISISLSYKYGNENAKYNTVNTMGLGFKYKY